MIGGTVIAGGVAWLLARLCLPVMGSLGSCYRTRQRLAARNLARYDGRPTAAVVSMVMAFLAGHSIHSQRKPE